MKTSHQLTPQSTAAGLGKFPELEHCDTDDAVGSGETVVFGRDVKLIAV